MISHFFIDRPIFAAVMSIIIVLAGTVSLAALPVAQYPDITPPTVLVTASYPGANCETVRDTVAAPIEQQVSGVENMIYMSSQCTNDGMYTLTVTFKLGTNPDMAQVLVQNRVSLAQPVIPDLVQRQGINVKKVSPSIMMIVNFVSDLRPDGKPYYDDLYLSNYATIQVRDELGRVDGVGNVTYLGERDYSMRAWLDPDKLATLGLTTKEVVDAIQEQNMQVAAGQIGQQPVPKGQQFTMTINTLGRLVSVEEFGDIVVKVGQQNQDAQTASVVHLRDIARIELGAQQYDQSCTLDGRPSVALSVYQLPGSNALQTAKGVYKKMDELAKRFPPGMKYKIVYDTTPFIKESVVEVFKTLRDAVILVGIVVLVFLQNWRATLIPLVAVPVAIIGTFAAMAAMGFSLNNLSLFGLVLAIGIVVDDAIVVVENVERWLELGQPPREAARRAMDEVTGPVVAVALVLCAVFVPCAFIGGITGQFFRQFAITIAVSTVISAFNSLTLSPALAALLLKPHKEGERQEPLPRWGIALLLAGVAAFVTYKHGEGLVDRFVKAAEPSRELETTRLLVRASLGVGAAVVGALVGWFVAPPVNGVLARFFGLFNRGFTTTTNGYTRAVSLLLRGSLVALVVYAGLLGLTGWSFNEAPSGFIPDQDKGYLLLNVQLPDSSSVERTQAAMAHVDRIVRGDPSDRKNYPGIPGVKSTVSISGQSLLLNANAPNLGWMYVILEPFEERRAADRRGPAIAAQVRKRCAEQIQGALVGVFGAPPIDGLGTAGGFKLIVEDRGNLGIQALQKASDRVVNAGNGPKTDVQGLFTSSRVDTPWIYLDIDRVKCMSMGVSVSEVFNCLQVNIGSYYVNNFNEFGRSWQVNVQADTAFRKRVSDIGQLKVKNKKGQMVPLATVVQIREESGPVMVMRYNMYAAAAVYGNPKPGVSSGETITTMEGIADKSLPRAMAYDWTELTYMQLQAGSTAMFVFGLAVVFVFLVLAAQYESWSLPLAVILVVPMCLLCSVVGVMLMRMDVNIFTQIGFVVLVGLASKNAILIVEFAKQQRQEGQPAREATLEACRLRLRPILMTSFAFILGVVPLVIAEGAGAEMRRALGTAVFSGMLGVTLFGIFLTPVFYYVIQWFARPPLVTVPAVAEEEKAVAKETLHLSPDGPGRETGIQERPD